MNTIYLVYCKNNYYNDHSDYLAAICVTRSIAEREMNRLTTKYLEEKRLNDLYEAEIAAQEGYRYEPFSQPEYTYYIAERELTNQ